MSKQTELTAPEVLNLADIKAKARYLYGMRKGLGWSVKEMQQGNGHAHGYIARMLSDERYPWDWRWSTFTNLGECLGFDPQIKMSGLVLAPTPLLGLGAHNPAFRAVGILESLRTIRNNRGLTAGEVGAVIGVGNAGVPKIESSDNPLLTSMMRLARGLGGELRYVVGEK